MYFVGSILNPTTRATLRDWNADAEAAKRHARRMTLGAELPPPGSASRKDVLRRLRLDEGASDEEIYQAALAMFDLFDYAKRDQAPQGLGYRRIGVGLSKASKEILAAGEARDLGEAQRIALRRDPSLGRR